MIESIEWEVMSNGRKDEPLWFHPRACRLPAQAAGSTPRVLMTAQEISGSDYFHPVHWTETADIGTTWSTPKPVPGFDRTAVPGTEIERGVCDVVPEYHAPTRTVLAVGHTVFYRAGVFFLPQPPRNPVYAVFDAETRNWGEVRRLEWDRRDDLSIYSSGCAQRHTLPDGHILIPLSYREHSREDAEVTTVRASFDGETCRIVETGSSLALPVKRGLLEPTIASHDGRFYLSIRAEDDRGYLSVSDDGLSWSPIRPWCWDDGEPLTMSTTQSRWLPHSDGLYLVYTRRDEHNRNVMRWRAPLYLARVDLDALQLIRETERVVVPLRGDGVNDPDDVARLGNFHTVAVTADESWVTVGESRPKAGYRGDTIIGRIRWRKPNRDLAT